MTKLLLESKTFAVRVDKALLSLVTAKYSKITRLLNQK